MRIVLVRPRDPNNIGAVARAMANFGVVELVVVDPYPPVWREAKSAVGASEVLATARETPTLDEAIIDCAYVGATTAGTRRRLESPLTPAAFVAEARAVAAARVALVFGNEKSGLGAADIERCHVAVRIPTNEGQPSMNLGHAVAVCCYELARSRGAAAPSARRVEPAATLEAIEAALVAAFPLSPSERVEARRAAARGRLRRLLLRARATGPDVALVRGLVQPDD